MAKTSARRTAAEAALTQRGLDPAHYSGCSIPQLEAIAQGYDIGQTQANAPKPSPFPADCQTNGQKFRWAVGQNLAAIGDVIRGE